MVNKAVIITDMLNDFVIGSLKCESAPNNTQSKIKLIDAARENKVPVIYSNDAHIENDFELKKRWENHAIKGTPEAEVIPELEP